MKHSGGEFILVLDADQVARPYIIRKLIGYFVREQIAFVQSAQTCTCPKCDPYNSRDLIFNRSMQLSKDAGNAVISCGSGVIYRRSAIQDIGGFSGLSLAEDLHTSYKLQQKGHIGIFFNYALSKGIAPVDFAGAANKKRKCASDALRIFFWDNPLSKSGLSLIQKINYFDLGLLNIFTGICIPIYLILPVWSLASGRFIVSGPASEFLLYRIPYLALTVSLNNFLFRIRNMVKVYQARNFFFPVCIQGIIDALAGSRVPKTERLTDARIGEGKRLPWWATAKLQAVILFLYLVSLSYSILTRRISKEIFFINILWVAWAVALLLPLTLNVLIKQFQHTPAAREQ
jgi:cellulose synthase (UDP-forming)